MTRYETRSLTDIESNDIVFADDAIVSKSADISPCGTYRYSLTRHWDAAQAPLTFIMLNPSTADATTDDPTIRRCIGFARLEGAGGIVVGNVYAFRSSSPNALRAAADPQGLQNEEAIRMMISWAGLAGRPVVCAWGAHPIDSDAWNQIATAARARRVRLVCLGKTKHGHPRHPLYVGYDQPLEKFDMSIIHD